MDTPRQRRPEDYPDSFGGGEPAQHDDQRIGEIRQDVERDEGGPTHDRSGARTPRRSGETDDAEGDGRK